MKRFSLFLFIFTAIISFYSYTWEKFYSVEGSCEVLFPKMPYHIKQSIPIAETQSFLNYDVYLSVFDESNSICMMVVANFPQPIEPGYEKNSLEGFINGIINHKNDKKILQAKFNDYKGLEALDFLIKNQTRLLKGKAVIFKSKLYLIAMEYDETINMEKTFEHFLNSFSFKK